MGVFSGGSDRGKNVVFVLCLILLIPYVVKCGISPKRRGSINWNYWIFWPIAFPVRLCRRAKQKAWKALGWDQLHSTNRTRRP